MKSYRGLPLALLILAYCSCSKTPDTLVEGGYDEQEMEAAIARAGEAVQAAGALGLREDPLRVAGVHQRPAAVAPEHLAPALGRSGAAVGAVVLGSSEHHVRLLQIRAEPGVELDQPEALVDGRPPGPGVSTSEGP